MGVSDLPEFLDALIAAVNEQPLTRPELAGVETLHGLRPVQLERLIGQAVDAGALIDDDGTLRPAAPAEEPPAPDPQPQPPGRPAGRPMRVVAIDFESVVRTTAAEPYTERRAFQVGALRFGRDRTWVNQRRSMTSFCALPDVSDGPGWLIYSDEVRARHTAEARPAEQWLAELDQLLDGADAVVAYNGFELDFPLLDDERRRAGLPPLAGVELIDGLLVALSLFPNPPNNHRLAAMAERLSVDMGRYSWHDAYSDCRLLATVICAGARSLRTWDPYVAAMLIAACDDSPAWSLLADLARLAPGGPDEEDGIADLLEAALETAGAPARRAVPDPDHPPAPPATPAVPADVIGADGRVDPHLLAERIQGRPLERRPQQARMAELVGGWLSAGTGGLVEAPTATGKSLVLLAAALDWVRAAPGRKAVIATHTKQLQSQLAADVQRLVDAGISALSGVTDLVKGEANRLSLRALTLALADSVVAERRAGPLAEPAQRELLAYLTVRFVTAARLTDRWLAASVDTVDVPAIFERTSRGWLRRWLAALSQSERGEYRADAELGLSLRTARVRETLTAAPIVIANHALLLAHRDVLAGADPDGECLAVLVDEAHELEAAATDALSHEFSYQALERIPAEVGRFVAAADGHQALARLAETAGQLRRFLAGGVLPTAASRALERLSEPGATPGRRAVTLASPYSPARGGAPVAAMRHGLTRAHGYLEFARRMLAWWAHDDTGLAAADRWAAERFAALSSTVIAQQAALEAVLADLDLLLGPMARRVRRDPASGDDPPLAQTPPDAGHDAALAGVLGLPADALPAHAPPGADDGYPDADPDPGPAADPDAGSGDGDGDGAADEDPDADDEDDDDSSSGAADDISADASEPAAPAADGVEVAAPAPANRVVWMAETGPVHIDPRRLPLAVTTSPISLPADAAWQAFLAATPRLVLTSGTLRVAEGWEFVRSRLGVRHLPAEALDTPFDYAAQARLYCLADFPSWAEHPKRAERTVAHQVASWARLACRAHPDGGVTSGAMVLTTSRSSAAAIAAAAAPALAADNIPAAVTETLGNARAVETFRSTGGVLIGTRGLWQGVDIADPSRLSLVWVNKLPFAPFADPVIAARRAHALAAAVEARAADPERAADEGYYLPLAALALRQAVGRLIRSHAHRGVVVISDNKLSGSDARRRMYRRVFLGSLDPGLRVDIDGDIAAGNVQAMTTAWAGILDFAAAAGAVDPVSAAAAAEPEALAELIDLPEMRAVRATMLDPAQETALAAQGRLGEEVIDRCATLAQVLTGEDVQLKDEQRQAIAAAAAGEDLLAILPTGFGKSFCYQLPALVMPGVTIVVSPLVSLMVDQAMGLGATIGPMVRALTGPMRESNSRLGKTQVAATLRGEADHGIRLIYLSPERLADARFRDLIGEGTRRGIVRRIYLDEAHTLFWGDDFRPSFRRFDRWLAGLKAAHPDLLVGAFTATANRTVREGLRTRLFGLAAEAPPGGDRPGFRFVSASPLRPDLALWRRRLAPGGPNSVAGLIEAVVDALEGHAIFYCLTVKEVERLYAQIREYLGEANADRVLRYHGRLSVSEKSAVATTFKNAPRADADDFRPLIVVATSAFGLGVDRPDIRAVFAVSPPADLAALYQQLGRAGRDSSGRVPGVDDVPTNAAMALVTPRAWRTVTWMVNQELYPNTLRRLADRILTRAAVGQIAAVDVEDLAGEQVAEDVDAGRATEAALRSARTAEKYASAAMRVVATLSSLDVLDDLGDIPDRVRVTPGEVACPDRAWQAVIASLVGDPDAAGSGVDLCAAHARLSAVDGYSEVASDVVELWTGLAAAHDYGWVDVSQQVTRRRLVVYRPGSFERPAGFDSAVSGRRDRVNEELTELRAWFDDTGSCVHDGFARHFGADTAPPGTCATPAVRCSWHWNDAATVAADPPGAGPPRLHQAFYTPRPRPVSVTEAGRAAFERRLSRHLLELLWAEYPGLSAQMLARVLHGDDSWYSQRLGRRRRLWPSLLHHGLRGAMPGVRQRSVDAALAALAGEGKVRGVGEAGATRWRLVEHIAAEEARAARQAARNAAADPEASPEAGRQDPVGSEIQAADGGPADPDPDAEVVAR